MYVVDRSSAFSKRKNFPIAWFAGACLANVAAAQSLEVVETDSLIVVRRDTQVVVAVAEWMGKIKPQHAYRRTPTQTRAGANFQVWWEVVIRVTRIDEKRGPPFFPDQVVHLDTAGQQVSAPSVFTAFVLRT